MELSLPRIFEQPRLFRLQSGKLPHVESRVAHAYRHFIRSETGGFGPDYQLLAQEYQPLLQWADGCWDYLLSIEGCRFVPRQREPHSGMRGDYRAFLRQDFRRLLHRCFRENLIQFSQTPEAPALTPWLKARYWESVLQAYRLLRFPPDKRQRPLTAYSYLRCVPYRFLNAHHDEQMRRVCAKLPAPSRHAVDAYFLNFFTLQETAAAVGCAPERCQVLLAEGMDLLARQNRLAHCLLLQIERY